MKIYVQENELKSPVEETGEKENWESFSSAKSTKSAKSSTKRLRAVASIYLDFDR